MLTRVSAKPMIAGWVIGETSFKGQRQVEVLLGTQSLLLPAEDDIRIGMQVNTIPGHGIVGKAEQEPTNIGRVAAVKSVIAYNRLELSLIHISEPTRLL